MNGNNLYFVKYLNMAKDFLKKFCHDNDITLTPLREDVLSILVAKNKPMRAYDVLSKLKKKRENAEPPTVYRVLDFLVASNIVHRIESQNSYVCCEQLLSHNASHQVILFFCKKCGKCYEFEDHDVCSSIKQFVKRNHIKLDDTLLEIKGICSKCLA